MTRALKLTLGYAQAHGWLERYFEGLARGEAVATACGRCGRAWCPPLPHCPSDGVPTEWIRLAGTGRLVTATRSVTRLPFADAARPHVFGLVRLDGARNAMLARLDIPLARAVPGLAVKLARVDGAPAHPAQTAWFVEVI